MSSKFIKASNSI